MRNSSYRDPLDGPVKWERRKPVQPETSEVDPWAHIPDIKRPAKNSSQPPAFPTSKHQSPTPPKASAVKEKVAEIVLPQSPISSTQGASNVRREDITPNERHIANQILTDCSDMDELITVCSDLSGTKFQALIAPFINRLSQFIVGETINPEHVLFLLRTTLKITIPKQ